MKLLFVGTNRTGGGIESYFVTMVGALADAGFEVTAAVWPDGVIHRALAADPRIRLVPVAFRKRNDARATRELFRIARELRPAWIVGMFLHEFWPLAVVARALSIPLVLFEHVERRMHPVMTYLLPRFFTRMIAPSRFLREHLVESGIPRRKTALLPNPVPVDAFRPDAGLRAAARARLGFSPDDVVIGFVGRIEPRKGAPQLAAALREVMAVRPNVRALWVGDGELAESLRAATDASPDAARHTWIPFTPDVRPLFAAMDVHVLASVGRETFGRVLVEAEASGVAVIGSTTGGIPEALIDGETGLLVPPDDVPALARAILRLVDDAELRGRLACHGVAFARRFEAHAVVDRFARALRVGMQALDD